MLNSNDFLYFLFGFDVAGVIFAIWIRKVLKKMEKENKKGEN